VVLAEREAAGSDPNAATCLAPLHAVGHLPFGVLPLLHGRRVHVPLDALWWPDLERELALFPHVAFKDQVDSFTQALDWLREPLNRGGWWGVMAGDRESKSSGKVRMQAPPDVNCLLGLDGFPIPIVDQIAEVPQSMVYGLERSRWRRL
jgi:hypothetical protein